MHLLRSPALLLALAVTLSCPVAAQQSAPAVVLSAFEEALGAMASQGVPRVDVEVLRGQCLRAVAADLTSAGVPVPPEGARLDAAAAAALVAQWSRSPGQLNTPPALAEEALKKFCATGLKYAEYITAAKYQEIKQRITQGTANLGLPISLTDRGYICYPLPDSPAALAKIQPGDLLLTLEGLDLATEPLKLIAAVSRGKPGSIAQLRVRRSYGRDEVIEVRREAYSSPAMSLSESVVGVRARVLRFTEAKAGARGLAASLKEAFEGKPQMALLMLDVRGCGGGELEEAAAVAGLFIGPGKLVATLIDHTGAKQAVMSTGQALSKPPRYIIIEQDQGTASAAEVLIKALLHHAPGMVTTRGHRSHGKGVADKEMELPSGGLLRFPVVEMEGPDGTRWGGIGIEPTMKLQP